MQAGGKHPWQREQLKEADVDDHVWTESARTLAR